MRYAKWLFGLTAAVTLGTGIASAEVDNRLAVAIGQPGSDSFAFGTELWAMSQIALKPAHRIVLDSARVTDDQDRLSLLKEREVEAALVYGHIPKAYEDDVRAIMALWPRGVSQDDADPVHVLVHREVAADVVYLVTKAMFEHANYFKSAHDRLGIGLPGDAISGLDMPLHEGASRYYRESGVGLDALAVAAAESKANRSAADGQLVKSGTYRNFDDAAFEADEIDQIAAACKQALELGDLTSTGCEVYQDRLLDAVAEGNEPPSGKPQPEAVAAFATMVQSARDAEEGLFEQPIGQGGPAIRWLPSDDKTDDGDGGMLKSSPANATPRQPTM